MEGLEFKFIVVAAIYIVFIVLFNVFKAGYRPRSMRSARTRSITNESAGYATTAAQKMDRRLGYARVITTVLVIASFIVMAVVMWLTARS